MGRAAQLTIAGVAGVMVVSAVVGPMIAFAFGLMGLLLKVSFIILVGYVVLTLLKKRGEDDEDDEAAGGAPEEPTEPVEPIEVEVEEIEEDE